MSSPFLGMDPFIEAKEIWPGFHHDLASEIKASLNQHIGPKYYAEVESYTVSHSIELAMPEKPIYPDVGVFQPLSSPLPQASTATSTTLTPPIERLIFMGEIKSYAVRLYLTPSSQLITAIEILSPVNKHGLGLGEYQKKREQLLTSPVHLVELDLLRSGERPAPELAASPVDTDYILLVNRFMTESYRLSQIWPVAINEPLPLIPIPLLQPDPDIILNLYQAIQSVYQKSNYQYRLDYRQPIPPPKLRPKIARWWREQAKKKPHSS